MTIQLPTQFMAPARDSGWFAHIPAALPYLLSTETALPPAPHIWGKALGRYEKVILILADAFGWRFFERFAERPGSHRSLLQRFAQEGVVSKLTSMFPSTTAAHLTCIHSGLPPMQSGVYEWQYYEPALDALITPLMFSFAGDRERETLRPTGIAPETIFPQQTLYRQLSAQGVASTVFGHRDYTPSPYSKCVMRGADIGRYSTLPEAFVNLRQAVAKSAGPAYFFLYFDKIDSINHQYGPNTAQTEAEVELFLLALEHLFLRPLEKELHNTLLIVTADHGMASTNPNTTVYLNTKREFAGIERFLRRNRLGQPLLPAGSPRDFFLYVHDELLDETQRFLGERLEGKAWVVATQRLIDQGYFGAPPLSPSLLGRLGNLVILPYDGEAVWWYEKDRFEQKQYGYHGGLTPVEMEIPLLLLPFY